MSNLPPSLGLSTCCRCGPKDRKKKTESKIGREEERKKERKKEKRKKERKKEREKKKKKGDDEAWEQKAGI